MAIAFIADGGYNDNGTTTVVLTKPAGVVSGNLLVAFVSVVDSNATSTVTTLAGWTLIVGPQRTTTATGSAFNALYAFYKVAGGSEPATYTWTGVDGTGLLTGLDGNIRAYSGTATSGTIINFATGAVGTSGSAVVPTFSGHETFVSGEMYVGAAVDLNNTIASSTTPTLTNTFSNAGFFSGYFIGNVLPGSTPGTETFTAAGYGGWTAAIGFTILPPGGGNPSFTPGWIPSVATDTFWQAKSGMSEVIFANVQPSAGPTMGTKRPWRWDIAEQINWQWEPQGQTIREPAPQTVIKPIWWQPNVAPEAYWYAAPDGNATLSILISGGEPVGSMWVPEPAGEYQPWTWSPPLQTVRLPATITKPFSTQWRDDIATIETWQATSGWSSDVLIAFTAGGEPFSKPWHYDYDTETQWQWSNGWSSDVISGFTAGGKPSVNAWRYDYSQDAPWAWAVPQALIERLSPPSSSNPFHAQWRSDIVDISPWLWSYGMSSVGSAFIPSSSPIGGEWLNVVPDTPPPWRWNYDNNTISHPVAVVVLPFSNEWQANVAVDPTWQWSSGWASDALTALVVGGQPFAKEWRLDVVPQPDWQWTPPNGAISEPLVGKPFARLWRYDFAVESVWQGSPLKAPLPADFAATPFAKGWHYDVVPQPDWSWTPPNVAIELPVPGKNFGKLWRYDLAEITNWQWVAPNATLNEPEPPVHNQWRYDLTPDPVWQGVPVKPPVVGSFNTPLTVVWWPTPSQDTYWRAQAIPAQTLIGLAHKPFAKLWRYDFDDHTSWAWEPPNAAIGEPEAFPPIMPLWWRENLVPEPFWQRWSTPGISAYKPNVLTADPRFVSFLPKRRMVSFLEDGMPKGPDFSLMDVGELTTGSMDFARWLEPSVTIASVVSVVASNSFPSGGAAYINLLGAPSIGVVPKIKGGSGFAGTAVLQQWVGMAVGTALVVFTVLTSDGQTLSGWAHQPVGVPS